MRVAPLFVLFSLVACDFQTDAGEVTREDRSVDAFSRVDASSMLDVEIDVGGPEAVSIVCGEFVVDDIITEVDNSDTLNIRMRDGARWMTIGQCEVHVRVPALTYASSDGSGDMDIDGATAELTALFSEGSGDIVASGEGLALEQVNVQGSGGINVSGVDTDAIVVALEGSGDVQMSGRANFVDLRLNGSGEIDGVDFTTVDADVRLAGSGSISLTVTGSANVTLEGSGNVTLGGNPQITSEISGSGDIRLD